jgi:hypothetical protein
MSKEFFVTLTQTILDAIDSADYPGYKELCSQSLSCVEPESHGHLVHGMQYLVGLVLSLVGFIVSTILISFLECFNLFHSILIV